MKKHILERKTFIVRFSLLFILIVLFMASMFGEKVCNNGAGWDGCTYRDMAMTFGEKITQEGFSHYYTQRMLPWALINVCFSFLNVPLNENTILLGAQLLNVLALLFSIIAFYKIVNFYGFSINGEIVAFSLLFFTFPVVKLIGYYPFLTDFFALTITLWLFYFLASGKKWRMLLMALVGAFVWQSIWPMTLVIFALPRESCDFLLENDEKSIGTRITSLFKIAFIVCILICPLWLFLHVYERTGNLSSFDGFIPFFLNKTSVPVILVSTVLLCVYAYLILRPFSFDFFKACKHFFCNINWIYVAVSVALLFGMKYFLILISDPSELNPGGVFLKRLLWEPISMPLKFLECHLYYYGLVVVLLLVLYEKSLSAVCHNGYPFLFCFLFILIFATQCESRFIVNMLPFAVFPIVWVLDSVKFKKWVLPAFVAVQLFLSRFWFLINKGSTLADYGKPVETYLETDAQRYYMAFGPWQSGSNYLIGMVSLLILYLFVKIGVRRQWFVESERN